MHNRFLYWNDEWDGSDQSHLFPWQAFSHDPFARSLGTVTVALSQTATASPRYVDLNTIALWHNLCMTLGANITVFEYAAGRAGAGVGSKALADITDWARTPTARRTCIHAAQTHKLLSNRKVSDNIMLNSTTALFTAAIVLSLYIFVSPPPSSSATSHELRFDIMEDVDWTLVGECGLSNDPASASLMYEASQNTPATDFINFGSAISIGGVAYNGGFASARRILLDYAHLMDEMGPWKPRMLSRILHIMSDVLEEGV